MNRNDIDDILVAVNGGDHMLRHRVPTIETVGKAVEHVDHVTGQPVQSTHQVQSTNQVHEVRMPTDPVQSVQSSDDTKLLAPKQKKNVRFVGKPIDFKSFRGYRIPTQTLYLILGIGVVGTVLFFLTADKKKKKDETQPDRSA
jgi:hypothetical protein